MALRSGVANKHEIPGEPGEWMDLRALGWGDLDAARRAAQTASMESVRALGADLFKSMQEMAQEMTLGRTTAAADPLAGYDVRTVLNLGIAAWSYDETVTPESIGRLDPATAEWAARIIVGANETEADRKNG